MVDPKFVAKILRNFNFSGFSQAAETVAKRSGRSKAVILADMLACGLLYGCGYNDYRLCYFEELSCKERKTYFTRGYNNRLVKLLNDPDNDALFDNKVLFLTKFREFAGRDWIDLRTADLPAFRKFLEGKEFIIGKPIPGTCGWGVQKLRVADFASAEELFTQMKKDNLSLAEDYLVQHPAISAVYPWAVNTLRIVTITTNSAAHVVYAFIRIGNNGAVVDNLNSGGMCAPIDTETGIVTKPAYDKEERVYAKHPSTSAEIVGLRIPLWDQAVKICRDAAATITGTRYIAWDVCITEKGPVFVEGNCYPGHDIVQLPPHIEHGAGMLPIFRRYVPEL